MFSRRRASIPIVSFNCDFSKIKISKQSLIMSTLKLKNLRNSCYINVIIQVIYRNVELRYFICKKMYLDNDMIQPVCNSLYLLFSRPGIVTDAENLRSVLESYYNLVQFNNGSMNDSQEFLSSLLGCVEKEISPRNESRDYILGLFKFILTKRQNYINDTLTCPFCSEDLVPPSEEDQLHEAWHVPVPAGRLQNWTLEELIVKETTGGEVNKRPCPVCKREDIFRYKETVEFKTLPKYLVINLKKYYYNGYDIVKNNSSVKFEEFLT